MIAAAGVLSLTEAIQLEALCCGEDNACCTNDCGCEEEPVDPPIINDPIDDPEDEGEEPAVIIIDDPEEEEPVVEEVPDDFEPGEEEETEVPEMEKTTPITDVETLPDDTKEDIAKEVCDLPWDLPAEEVEELVDNTLGI